MQSLLHWDDIGTVLIQRVHVHLPAFYYCRIYACITTFFDGLKMAQKSRGSLYTEGRYLRVNTVLSRTNTNVADSGVNP